MLTTVLIGIFLAFLTWPRPVVVYEFDLHTIHTIHKLINLLIGFDFPQWYFVSCVQYLRKSPEQSIIHVTFISKNRLGYYIHILVLYPSSHTCTCTPVGILLQLGKVLENTLELWAVLNHPTHRTPPLHQHCHDILHVGIRCSWSTPKPPGCMGNIADDVLKSRRRPCLSVAHGGRSHNFTRQNLISGGIHCQTDNVLSDFMDQLL